MAAPTARTARRSETPSADGRPHRRPGRPMARSPAVTAPTPLDVTIAPAGSGRIAAVCTVAELFPVPERDLMSGIDKRRSEEHTSELQSRGHLVCRLLLEKKNKKRVHA